MLGRRKRMVEGIQSITGIVVCVTPLVVTRQDLHLSKLSPVYANQRNRNT